LYRALCQRSGPAVAERASVKRASRRLASVAASHRLMLLIVEGIPGRAVLAGTISVAVSGAGLGLMRVGYSLSSLAAWTTFLALPGHIGVRWQNVRFSALCSLGLSLGASVDAALARSCC
jgi:hypothetical protein